MQYVEIRNLDPTPGARLEVKTEYEKFLLPLDDVTTTWQESIARSRGTCLTGAERHGISFSSGSHHLDAFHRLIATDSKRLGTPVHSRRFYLSLLSRFGSNAELLMAHREERAVAGLLLLRDHQTISAVGGDNLYEPRQPHAGEAIVSEAIKRAHAQGASLFDLGRSRAGSDSAAWKRSWGAEAHSLHYEYFLNRAVRLPPPNQENPRLRFARSVWMRLPLSLIRAVGPHLMKYRV